MLYFLLKEEFSSARYHRAGILLLRLAAILVSCGPRVVRTLRTHSHA